jgi:hypothetical protein
LRSLKLDFKQVSNDVLSVLISLLQGGSERLQRSIEALISILLFIAAMVTLLTELRESLLKRSPELEGRE